jgi:hypothetical protein
MHPLAFNPETCPPLCPHTMRTHSPLSLARLITWILLLWVVDLAHGQAPQTPRAFSTEQERCIVPAAQFHQVNHDVLRAILRVETRLNPGTVTRNTNGTLDVGMGGMNSSNFPELAKHGVAPEHLLDACVASYVAAWHLKKNIAKYGNTWFGVAAYHSTTPYFNRRYQALLYNELVKSGTLEGALLPVPPLR